MRFAEMVPQLDAHLAAEEERRKAREAEWERERPSMDVFKRRYDLGDGWRFEVDLASVRRAVQQGSTPLKALACYLQFYCAQPSGYTHSSTMAHAATALRHLERWVTGELDELAPSGEWRMIAEPPPLPVMWRVDVVTGAGHRPTPATYTSWPGADSYAQRQREAGHVATIVPLYERPPAPGHMRRPVPDVAARIPFDCVTSFGDGKGARLHPLDRDDPRGADCSSLDVAHALQDLIINAATTAAAGVADERGVLPMSFDDGSEIIVDSIAGGAHPLTVDGEPGVLTLRITKPGEDDRVVTYMREGNWRRRAAFLLSCARSGEQPPDDEKLGAMFPGTGRSGS